MRKVKECERCRGSGYIIQRNTYAILVYPSRLRFERVKCPDCKGKGIVTEELHR